MTIDEAIIHAEEIADKCDVTDGDKKCGDEHRKLAEWLKELKRLKEKDDAPDITADTISRELTFESIVSGDVHVIAKDGFMWGRMDEITAAIENAPSVHDVPGTNVGDMVCRQAAIEAIDQYGSVWMEYTEAMSIDEIAERALKASKQSMIKILHDLPSAERTGKWIETAEEYYKAINDRGWGVNEDTPYFVDDIACSECLSKFSTIDNNTERFYFCPNCGADMRGEEK